MRGLTADSAPDLEPASAEEVLRFAVERFHPRLYVACSFQKEASVIMDLLLRIDSPKGGAYIDPLSLNPGEQEVLFPPGLRYRVVEKTQEDVGGRSYRVLVLEIETDG